MSIDINFKSNKKNTNYLFGCWINYVDLKGNSLKDIVIGNKDY